MKKYKITCNDKNATVIFTNSVKNVDGMLCVEKSSGCYKILRQLHCLNNHKIEIEN